MARGNCNFTGNGGIFFSTVLIHLFILSAITLGLYLPWAWVRIFKLKASHTTIQEKGVQFVGTGGQLLVLGLVQGLITLITLGLYGPWAICKFFDWKARNTIVGGTPSRFKGTGGGLFPLCLVHLVILPVLTFGIYYVYGFYRLYAWKEEHTLYAGEKTSFSGRFRDFLKISVISWILNFMTMNLFTPWSLAMLFNWQIKGLAVGDEQSVEHFPPVRTNFAVAAAVLVIGLVPVALIGLFVKSQYDKIVAAAQMVRMVRVAPHPSAKKGTPFKASVPGESRPIQSMRAKIQVQKKIERAPSKVLTSPKATGEPSVHAGEDADAIYNRAWFVGSQGNLQEAENLYTQVIALNNKDADAYYNRGLIRMQTNQYDLSVKDFTTALELNSKFFEAYCNRGNAHYRAGRSDLAINDYGVALQLKPDDGDLYFNRGIVLLAMGRKQEATNDLKQAARMGQQDAAAYLRSPAP
jgi:tetratricopeptide (TPR) repeat protein